MITLKFIPESCKPPLKVEADSVSAALMRHCDDLAGVDLTGERIENVNLRYARMHDADLRNTRFVNCNLNNADLRRVNAQYAHFDGCTFDNAIMHDANLTNANFRCVSMYGCDLYRATLPHAAAAGVRNALAFHDALLLGANVPESLAAQLCIVPAGDLVVWKKCLSRKLVKLLIPAGAKRSNATGRKCRAEYANVLSIEDINEPTYTFSSATSMWDYEFTYCVGATVRPHLWHDDRWKECAGGIHFFLTRDEAAAFEF